MPTIVRKTGVSLMEVRREVLHAVSWQVRSTIWSPPTDVYETDAAYIVRVEIAGMREEDFEVSLENHTLHISGVRPDSLGRRAYHQMEIRFGKFASSIGLPCPVSVERSRAEYKDGFLTVTLPKESNNQIKVE
ncbi:MAG: Hsp20/alpha crystallin family protein [Anaerolineales bacterium]|nr:Hsp20/alpha crystallin family protein [Anaerolineales bacterium]